MRAHPAKLVFSVFENGICCEIFSAANLEMKTGFAQPCILFFSQDEVNS
jgi:hypothetical protein